MLREFSFKYGNKTITGKLEDDIPTAKFDDIIKNTIQIKSMSDYNLDIRSYMKLITLAAVTECSAFKPGDLNEWDKLGVKLASRITKEVVKYYPLLEPLREMISAVAGSTKFEIDDISSALTTSDGIKKQSTDNQQSI